MDRRVHRCPDGTDDQAFAAMRDRGVRRIAARYGSMDPVRQRQLLAIADAIASVHDDRDPDVDDADELRP